MSTFKIGDKVFIYVAPNHVSDPSQSLIWECTITDIEEKKKIDEDGETVSVRLGLECGIDSTWKDSKEVFTNIYDAMAHGVKMTTKYQEALLKKAEIARDLIKLLESGEYIEDWMNK